MKVASYYKRLQIHYSIMNKNKNTIYKNTNIQRLTKTLIFAYSINKNNLQESEPSEQFITSWIQEYLCKPNDKLAEIVMPLLIEDFEMQISNNKGDNNEYSTITYR